MNRNFGEIMGCSRYVKQKKRESFFKLGTNPVYLSKYRFFGSPLLLFSGLVTISIISAEEGGNWLLKYRHLLKYTGFASISLVSFFLYKDDDKHSRVPEFAPAAMISRNRQPIKLISSIQSTFVDFGFGGFVQGKGTTAYAAFSLS